MSQTASAVTAAHGSHTGISAGSRAQALVGGRVGARYDGFGLGGAVVKAEHARSGAGGVARGVGAGDHRPPRGRAATDQGTTDGDGIAQGRVVVDLEVVDRLD